LSHLFGTRFEKAKCPDLRFHDLRHHATSRIYERTNLTDLEVASITGHTNLRMLQRYANLRGSKLASRLW
jgi:integrase